MSFYEINWKVTITVFTVNFNYVSIRKILLVTSIILQDFL